MSCASTVPGVRLGSISVRYELRYDSADTDDMAPATGTLTWASGDASPRTILLVPVDDNTMEGEERFRVRLSEATGGAGLGAPEIEVTIEDDEALRALQFVEPAPQILEGESADITITRPCGHAGALSSCATRWRTTSTARRCAEAVRNLPLAPWLQRARRRTAMAMATMFRAGRCR